MNQRFIFGFAFGLSLVAVHSEESNTNCENKDKSMASLDVAVGCLTKAKDIYPKCEGRENVSNSSECRSKGRSLGYIEIALNLVKDAKENYPVCPPPTKLEPLHPKPVDCKEVLENGYNYTGYFDVWPRNRVSGGKPIRVRCDMETDGGGWTVIQRRGNFSKQEDFNRDWKDYKNGFGDITHDFWIGNDNIYALSNQGVYALRLDMTDVTGTSSYEQFQDFWIEDEASNYKLHVGQSSGPAGDSMKYHDGSMFSTKDVKNDNWTSSCAILRKSGFWYHKCSHCSPNGLYQPGAKGDPVHMYYYKFRGYDGLLSFEMKMKRL